MARLRLPALLALPIVLGTAGPALVQAQGQPDLAGRWALSHELSQLPREIGFGLAGAPTEGSGSSAAGSGGRGRRRSSGGGGGVPGGFTSHPESQDDATRVGELTAEARNPSERLTIAETPTAVTITDDRGQSRRFHPDGKEALLQLDGAPVSVTAKWDAGRLVVLYDAEEGRQVRYTYSRTTSPPQLVVEVQFIERGEIDAARRIYETASATNSSTEAQAPATATPSSASGDRLPAPAQTANLQPGAEFKGLTKLGIVVEDLSPQAAACGLNRGTLEMALTKRVSDAGFTILRNSDEDTYLYVNIITTSLPSGLCVSRYDAFIYAHTTARLSYGPTPALVEVSLLHKGGLSGGAPSTHGADVQQGVQQYVDQFLAQIRAANK
jgi:hypothetical protein